MVTAPLLLGGEFKPQSGHSSRIGVSDSLPVHESDDRIFEYWELNLNGAGPGEDGGSYVISFVIDG